MHALLVDHMPKRSRGVVNDTAAVTVQGRIRIPTLKRHGPRHMFSRLGSLRHESGNNSTEGRDDFATVIDLNRRPPRSGELPIAFDRITRAIIVHVPAHGKRSYAVSNNNLA